MKDFTKMKSYTKDNIRHFDFTNTKMFDQEFYLSNDSIRKVFAFSYEMAPQLHREYRTGGEHIRKPNEIFVNTFTGKLSEFALYEYLSKYDIVVNVPDLRIYPRNEWDTEDLIITVNSGKNYLLNVKSTKHFGHLLLLEEGDYNANGIYTPDNSQSDFYVLVRFQFDLENKLKSMGQLYSRKLMKDNNLKQLINEVIQEVDLKDKLLGKKNTKIYYDIPGYITHKDLVHIINNDFIIKQGDYLRTVKMDAHNYYIQSGDLRPIDNIINLKHRTYVLFVV